MATIIGAEPLDLAKKIEKLKTMRGPRMLISLAPCPTGWDYDPKLSVEIGRLAVQTGVWPLKEYINGEVIHTKIPKKDKSGKRIPVEEYLKLQGRFKHLFHPQRDDKGIAEIQASIDAYWDKVTVCGLSMQTAIFIVAVTCHCSDKVFLNLFLSVVEAFPDQEAVVSLPQQRRLSYGEFSAAIDELARGLSGLGFKGLWHRYLVDQ